MARKKKRKSKEPHPCLFVYDGSIRHFAEGSMLELCSSVTPEEWAQIAEETIKYQIFLECLKEVAYPILKEQWTEIDEWYRLQLGVAVSRIRNLDPLLGLKHNVEAIKQSYAAKMRTNASEVAAEIESIREAHRNIEAALKTSSL